MQIALDPELAAQLPVPPAAEAAEAWEQGISGRVGALGPVGECTEEEDHEREVALASAAGEPDPGAGSEDELPPPPGDEKAKMEALRAVLHKLSKQSPASEAQEEERRLPGWRRFFSKRSA